MTARLRTVQRRRGYHHAKTREEAQALPNTVAGADPIACTAVCTTSGRASHNRQSWPVPAFQGRRRDGQSLRCAQSAHLRRRVSYTLA
jgi:hypothetical protein